MSPGMIALIVILCILFCYGAIYITLICCIGSIFKTAIEKEAEAREKAEKEEMEKKKKEEMEKMMEKDGEKMMEGMMEDAPMMEAPME